MQHCLAQGHHLNTQMLQLTLYCQEGKSVHQPCLEQPMGTYRTPGFKHVTLGTLRVVLLTGPAILSVPKYGKLLYHWSIYHTLEVIWRSSGGHFLELIISHR